jgi:heme exporter protein A
LSGEARLVAQAVSVFRGDRLVLDRLELAAGAGEAVLLLGPNGAGKSTLLRALAGLKRLDGGSITLDGTAEMAGRAAYLGHQDGLKPGLSALENLAFACRVSGLKARPALDAFDLAPLADLPARMLSSGQKRRLALARTLLCGADLLLLDEPTVGLDTASVARLGTVLAAHRAAGGMVVAATHLPLPLPGAREYPLAA